MSSQTIAKKDGSFIAVCTVPDVCKTPCGPSMVPVPYPIMADLSKSTEVVEKVRANGKGIFVLNDSEVPNVTGNEAGTGGGVMSGVNRGAVRAVEGSSSVRVCRKYIVRNGDMCEMNNG